VIARAPGPGERSIIDYNPDLRTSKIHPLSYNPFCVSNHDQIPIDVVRALFFVNINQSTREKQRGRRDLGTVKYAYDLFRFQGLRQIELIIYPANFVVSNHESIYIRYVRAPFFVIVYQLTKEKWCRGRDSIFGKSVDFPDIET